MKNTFLALSLLLFSSPAGHPRSLSAKGRVQPPGGSRQVYVAAAADLRYAMDALAGTYMRAHRGVDIEVTYGSSGNFYAQLLNDAPFDAFFSADMDYPAKLKENGKTLGDVVIYGTGHLVLWSKVLDPNEAGMNTLLDPSVNKISIANPTHAPFGQRAIESLRYFKLYDKVRDRLVVGENISQAAQYAATGAAEVGLIAESLAESPEMRIIGARYWLVPAESYTPLHQGCTLTKHAAGNADAKAFFDYVGSAGAKDILARFGITNP